MKLRPLYDRVIVRRVEEDNKSAGGIVIPDNAKEKPARGEVISVGNGKLLESGEVKALIVKEGDTVIFGKYAGQEVKVGSEDLLVLKEEEIMGILEA